MRVQLNQVPIAVRRLAANHLASIRGTELMAGNTDARLGPEVVPIYRPDMEDVAYYEVAIVAAGVGGARVLSTSGYSPGEATKKKSRRNAPEVEDRAAPSGQTVGFMVVTNGTHDFPISHWSLQDAPPSAQVLEDPSEDCEPRKPVEGTPARIYRLDALSYVAEDANGEIIGTAGQMPGVITGLPHNLKRLMGAITSAVTQPFRDTRDDSSAEGARHEVDSDGPPAPELKQSDDVTWQEYKDRYADAFGPLLDRLRNDAAESWAVEDLIAEFGEGILTGTTHRIDLLDHARIELSGEGRAYVKPRMEDDAGAPLTLVLHVPPVSLDKELDLNVTLEYRNGERERLEFFIVSPDVPSNTRADLERNLDHDCEGD